METLTSQIECRDFQVARVQSQLLQNRTNVVQCCVKFSSRCLNDCCEVVRLADLSPHQISNPFETRGSFFEKVISP